MKKFLITITSTAIMEDDETDQINRLGNLKGKDKVVKIIRGYESKVEVEVKESENLNSDLNSYAKDLVKTLKSSTKNRIKFKDVFVKSIEEI